VIAIIVATIYLSQQPLGRPPAVPPATAQTDNKFTTFTDAGIEYATSARFVSVNVTDRPIAASDIGLSDDETVTIPAAELGNRLRITLGREVVEVVPVGSVSVTSEGGVVTQLVYTDTGYGIGDARRTLLADVDQFGLPSDQIATVVSTVKQSQRDGKSYSETLEPGTALGVPVTPNLSCDTDGYCLLTHTIALD
jgi:hypothetical protein